MSNNLKVIGFSGSLRKNSFNSALLRAAQTLMPAGMTLEIIDLQGIPLYNGDLENEHYPDAVRILREKIRVADGILIATPEYNYSIPGVLKNAIDWLSRPGNDPVFSEKPLAIMGASLGMMGTSRAQYHLRQVAVFLNMHVLNKPEFFLSFANTKFDEQLSLSDVTTKDFLLQFLQAFQKWIVQLNKMGDV